MTKTPSRSSQASVTHHRDLRTGQSIMWPDRGGQEHRLTIIAVKQPSE